jgi:hypothetical protein
MLSKSSLQILLMAASFGLGLGGAAACTPGGGAGGCEPGTENCECIGDMCLGGAECVAGFCVFPNAEEGEEGETGDTGGTGDCNIDGCPEGSTCGDDGVCVPNDCSQQACPGLSYCDPEELVCLPGCNLDKQCEDDEVCDLDSHSCVCAPGLMACGSQCIPDSEICAETCGDGELDPNEACDGANLGGLDCLSEGFDGGELGCSSDCSSIELGSCYGCGDGELNPGEECDGNQFGGESCVSLGWNEGNLVCTAGCTIDSSGCNYGSQPGQGPYAPCSNLEWSNCTNFTQCVYYMDGGWCAPSCNNGNDANCQVDNLPGTAVPVCLNTNQCALSCENGEICPIGMDCLTTNFGKLCI